MKGIPELADAISNVGLLQSIAHIPREDWLHVYPETEEVITAPYVILFGEHRWRAMGLLGKATISSVVRVDLVERARLVTLVENLRRAELSPLEEAEHYQALREESDPPKSYEQIAADIGETAKGAVSKGTVWKRIRLLELTPEARDALREGDIPVSAAEHLLRLDNEDAQRIALHLIVSEKMNPAAARAEAITRSTQPQRNGNAPQSTVSSGNDTAQTALESYSSGKAVSTGNTTAGVGSEEADSKETVSSGNDVPSPRSNESEDSTRTIDKQTQAAIAREAACRALLENIDPNAPKSTELLLHALTNAILMPQQQKPAQQRALTWLTRVDRHGVEEKDVSRYFQEVQEQGDAALQRLAALATALATGELRTASRRQRWGARERGFVTMLIEYADYEPTPWEYQQLALAKSEGRS